MRFLVFPLSLMMLITSLAASHAQAPVPDIEAGAFNPLVFGLQLAQEPDPQERLQLIDGALDRLQAQAGTDPKVVLDLLQEKVDLLLELDKTGEAAALLAGMASYADKNRDSLDVNIAALLHKAAELNEQNGNLRQASRLLEQELEERRSGMQFGDPVARVMNDLARVAQKRGNTKAFQQFTASAEAVLTMDRPGAPGGTKAANNEGGFREVEIYYATDRARSGSNDPGEYYGYDRGQLEYGIVTVSIPDIHVPGAIEAPSIWRLEFGPDASKHVMVQKVDPKDVSAFYARMNADLEKHSSKEAFVFIHGYNVTFDAAAKRAGQLAYDMNYSGLPILYSWPSAGKTTRYIGDEAVVRLSGRRLARFLEELRQKSGAETIHIVAHSMGNRALTDALEILALKNTGTPDELPLFGQVFFAAPDVDADLFAEMAKSFHPVAQRLTLYTSEEDWALKTSRELHGSATRAGLGGDNQLASSDFDTIDMTGLGTDMLSHSYFADDSSALADMLALLWRNPAPGKRCGLAPHKSDGDKPTTWRYLKDVCHDRDLLALLAQLRGYPHPDPATIRKVVEANFSDKDQISQWETLLLGMTGQ
ncbi:alpha/beta hydrolase [uncultured Roseibium sp.]|uniref:alpha/beta hydrolase n=1 Tax=uncultured Roseibium sp. TaxID=1936171 RepID=UPI0032168912